MPTKKICKECPPGIRRVASYPGPRCYTHHKQAVKARREAASGLRLAKIYGLRPGQYDRLKLWQNGTCAICRRATGKTKKLAVDHDHKTGYVRGLLCGPCNKILGHARDDAEFFARAAKYLREPPAFKAIGMVKPDE